MPQQLDGDAQRAGGGIAADERNVMSARQRGEPRGKFLRASASSAVGKRQRQQRPRRPRAHRRQIAQIHGKRAMADGGRGRAVRESARPPPACRWRRRARIRADTPAAPRRLRYPARTSLRFAPQWRKYRSISANSEMAIASQCSFGRSVRAARSRTALTNLCPSVAPNRFVRLTASLMATRYGTSGLDSARTGRSAAPRARSDRELGLALHQPGELRVEAPRAIATRPRPARGSTPDRPSACPRRRRTPG